MCLTWVNVLGLAPPARAQRTDAPGPYVVDLRAGLGALPADAALFPTAPSGTRVATAGLALDAGGHVYLMRIGPARVGVGATFTRVTGKNSGEPALSSSGSSAALPAVHTRITAIAPQLSINFGTSDGWSYLSAGIGRANARTTVSAFTTGTGEAAVTTGAAAVSTSLRALNLGGGARWFTHRHLAISFDVRFHLVSDTGGEVPIPRTTLAVVTGGLSLR